MHGSQSWPVPGPDFKPGVRHESGAGGFDTHWLPPIPSIVLFRLPEQFGLATVLLVWVL